MSETQTLGVIAALALTLTSAAGAAAIRITDLALDKSAVEAGETFTVAVMATGGANFCIRVDNVTKQNVPKGWKFHGPRYAFIPSPDFPGPGPYKDAEICHRDGGARDLDERRGIFSIAVDTSGWPAGDYDFMVLATSRPVLGRYRGDTQHFRVTVYEPGKRPPAEPLRAGIAVAVNGRPITRYNPAAAICLGRPNAMTLAVGPALLPEAGWQVGLRRTLPDGRTRDASALLTRSAPRAKLDLGLFTAPAQYDFEAGVVYRRGCRFALTISDRGSGAKVGELHFYQTVDESNSREVLRHGDADRALHLGWANAKRRKPMDPPILLSLTPDALVEHDSVGIVYRLNCEARLLRVAETVDEIRGTLAVTSARNGEVMLHKQVAAVRRQAVEEVDVSGWPAGEYRIELAPSVDGSHDHDGPWITYRRRPDPLAVRLSPIAPWAFRGDPSRAEVVVTDFAEAVSKWSDGLPGDGDWELRPGRDGVQLITRSGHWEGLPVVLRPKLKGVYAVFALAEKGHCYVRVGKTGIPRGVGRGLCFVAAADLTDDEIAFYPADCRGSGMRELRLVPVTEDSVERTLRDAAHPPAPLAGVADWHDYFMPPGIGHSGGGRLGEEQFDALLMGHAEVGLREIDWAIGRSWVEYHSRLPQASVFPCAPIDSLEPVYQRRYRGPAVMTQQWDPLEHVLTHRGRFGQRIRPWLAMQRHYGENAYGGIFASKWFCAHPEWRRWSKGATQPSRAEVCYYFPEVRRERVDIFCEVAEKGPDGLVVGCCRQPPMLLYHPEMVAEYKRITGVHATQIDASRREEYERWIRWRANFFTETLRDLERRLGPIRAKTGKPIPVSVRVPSKGLFYNLAQGLDVETWCREGLVSRIQLDPLEDCDGRGSHDVRPYVELGKRHRVEIFGGVNGNTFWSYPVILRRALGLLDAGVDGIELYESNNFAVLSQPRWLVPLLGNGERIREFLAESNLEACYPIWSRHAAAGHDNHSFRGQWSVFGMGSNAL